MKLKVINILVAGIILMLMNVAAHAAADSGVELSVGSAYIGTGDTAQIPVYAEVHEGFAAFTLDIKYDPDVITPVSAKAGSILTGVFIHNLEYSEDTIRITYAGSVNTEISGILADLEFKAISQCDDISPLEININYLANEKYINVPGSTESGYLGVSVTSWMPIFCENIQADKEQKTIIADLSNLSAEEVDDSVIYIALYDQTGSLLSLYHNSIGFSSNEKNKRIVIDYDEAPQTAVLYVWNENMVSYMKARIIQIGE